MSRSAISCQLLTDVKVIEVFESEFFDPRLIWHFSYEIKLVLKLMTTVCGQPRFYSYTMYLHVTPVPRFFFVLLKYCLISFAIQAYQIRQTPLKSSVIEYRAY